MDSLISPDNYIFIWVVLFAITFFSLWAENKKFGKFFGGVVIAIIVGFILGNTGVLPTQAPIYAGITEYLVPVAIPLLLFRANINKIVKQAGHTLLAFFIGAFATVLGAVIAYNVIDLPAYQGAFTGTLAATFIGGGMNFAAVSHAMGIPPGDLLGAATAADNIITILFLLVLAAMPSIAFFANKYGGERKVETKLEKEADEQYSRLADYTSVIVAILIAVILVGIGNMTQKHLGWEGAGILVTTLLALLYATYAPELTAKLKGSFDMGMVLMMIFFASLGAQADLVGTLDSAPVFFGFVIIIVAVHAGILFTAGKFLKLTLPELITASNACILGPATAAGLAGTKGWKSLVTPGILVGILGYALANFIGVGLANWLG
ncbi:MAG: DUF819 family protein [Alphaproteobacteria bacterium]